MKHHELKLRESHWDHVADGSKTFEIRENDRDFQAGDTVTFTKLDRHGKETEEQMTARITYVTSYHQQPFYVVFGIDVTETPNDHMIRRVRELIEVNLPHSVEPKFPFTEQSVSLKLTEEDARKLKIATEEQEPGKLEEVEPYTVPVYFGSKDIEKLKQIRDNDLLKPGQLFRTGIVKNGPNRTVDYTYKSIKRMSDICAEVIDAAQLKGLV